MHRTALMKIALCVGVLMVVILALTACGSGSAQQEEAKPSPLPKEGQTLSPGEYRSGEFEPSLTFSVGKGWTLFDVDESNAFALNREAQTEWVSFTNVHEVYKPGTHKVVKVPEDLVGWFQHHPYLQTSKPESITVGGVKGKQFDVDVDAPEDYYSECGSDCVDIYRLSSGDTVGFEADNKTRIIVLDDINGESVAFDIGALEIEFDSFMPEANKVLDTVKWTGS